MGAVVVFTGETETGVTGCEGCAITPPGWDLCTVGSVAELTAAPPATKASSSVVSMLEVVESLVGVEVVEIDVVVGSLIVAEEVLVCTANEG